MSPRNSGHALKIISALEANPELEGAQQQFPNDFSNKSPSGHLSKFAKSQKRPKGAKEAL
jgi:hypothetical protein